MRGVLPAGVDMRRLYDARPSHTSSAASAGLTHPEAPESRCWWPPPLTSAALVFEGDSGRWAGRHGWHDDRVSVWDELTPEQYAVMINAIEEAYLNGVIYEYNLRVNGQRIGDALVAPPISEDSVRSMIPRFTEVVADLLAKGWIEIREPYNAVWDDAAPLTDAEIAATLADPKTWIWDTNGDNRMVMLMTTDRWDQQFNAQAAG